MARRAWSCFSSISTAVLYGSLSLFVSILHNVFLLYYVDTFVSVYKIDKVSFWVGETVFLIWNSLNDPLFGWISDRSFLGSQQLCVGQAPLAQEKELTLGQYLKQLSKHTNFLWFASMNLVQVFHCHFNSNFFPLFLEHLLSDRISASTGSFLLGFSYIAPHLNNLYFLSLCGRYGVYTVVRWLFFLKLILSVIMLLAGPDQIYLLCIFIASNRVFTEGTCKLLNLVISDLVDEDLVMNRRQQAASALLFGMVALVTKPGQTFAPLIGTWLLCVYTGYDIFQRDPLQEVVRTQELWNPAWFSTLRQGCFHLLIFIPITCAVLQLLAWSQFSLHGKRLQSIKLQRQSASQELPIDVKDI